MVLKGSLESLVGLRRLQQLPSRPTHGMRSGTKHMDFQARPLQGLSAPIGGLSGFSGEAPAALQGEGVRLMSFQRGDICLAWASGSFFLSLGILSFF